MTMPAEKPSGLNPANGENRRASKPMIEKRRRARINQSLAVLKAIVVDSRKDSQSQNARPPKLEKADILEMTVTHLKKLHECMEQAPASANDGSSYKAGFFKCIQMIREFVQTDNSLSFDQRARLLSHLCSAAPNLHQSSEVNGSQMDDTASSYSGSSSRSNTPSLTVNDTASMEYLPCSPPLSDSIQEGSSNSLSPPSRTQMYKNHTAVSISPNSIVFNKHPSRLPSSSSAFTASSASRVESESAFYHTSRPLNLASGSKQSDAFQGQNNSSVRGVCEVAEAEAKRNPGEHQFFENPTAENESLMQIDTVWRPW